MRVYKCKYQSESSDVSQKGFKQSPALLLMSQVLVRGFIFVFKGRRVELESVLPEIDQLADRIKDKNQQKSVC